MSRRMGNTVWKWKWEFDLVNDVVLYTLEPWYFISFSIKLSANRIQAFIGQPYRCILYPAHPALPIPGCTFKFASSPPYHPTLR